MASITLMGMRQTSLVVPTLRICITRLNVCILMHCVVYQILILYVAKKDDNPEEALKEFRAIVQQEENKGDW